MEDSFKFRAIRFPQRSGFMFPHEAEAERVSSALWIANVMATITVLVLVPLSLLFGDVGPFVIGVVLWAIAETRWRLLDYRLAKFMEGSGL